MDLLEFVTEAHGGLTTWRSSSTLSADVDIHGVFWTRKGQPDLLGPTRVTARLERQHIQITSHKFGRTIEFDAEKDLVTVSDSGSGEVEELSAPRIVMAGFGRDTPWTATQAGYFISYATWTYLLEPYLFHQPGVVTREIEPWHERGETWRRLEVTFPRSIASHEQTQIYYFDAATGLQRRLDYAVDINGRPPVSQYQFEHRFFNGFPIPSERRVMPRQIRTA